MALLKKEIFTYQNTVANLLTNLKAKQRGITRDTTNKNLLYKLEDNTPLLVANSHMYTGGAWVALDQDFALVSTTGLKDSRMSGSLPISQVGNTTLVGFTANSVIGCLNELHATMVSIDLPAGEIAFGNATSDGITSSNKLKWANNTLSVLGLTDSIAMTEDTFLISKIDGHGAVQLDSTGELTLVNSDAHSCTLSVTSVTEGLYVNSNLYIGDMGGIYSYHSYNGFTVKGPTQYSCKLYYTSTVGINGGILELVSESGHLSSMYTKFVPSRSFVTLYVDAHSISVPKMYVGTEFYPVDYSITDNYVAHFNGTSHVFTSTTGGYGIDTGVEQDFYINCNGTTPNITMVNAVRTFAGRKDYYLDTADPAGRYEISVSNNLGVMTPVMTLDYTKAFVYTPLDITGTLTCSGLLKPSTLTATRVPVMTATGLQDYAGLTYTAASFVLTSSGSTLAGFKSNATSTTGNSYVNLTNNSNYILQLGIYGSAFASTFAGVNYANLALLKTTRTFMLGSTTDYGVYIMNNSIIRVGVTSTGMAVGALASAGVATAAEFQVHAFMPAVTLTVFTGVSTSLMYPDGCSICADNQQTTLATTKRFSGVLLRTENTSGVLQHATIGAYAIAGSSVYSPVVACTVQTGASSYRTIWDATANATVQYFEVWSIENHTVYASTVSLGEPSSSGATLYLVNVLTTDAAAVEGQFCYQTFAVKNSSKTSYGNMGVSSALSSSKYSPSFFWGGNTGTATWQEYAYLTGGDDDRGTNFMLYDGGIYAGLSVTSTLGQLRTWDSARGNVAIALDWNNTYLRIYNKTFIGIAIATNTEYDLNVNNGIVATQYCVPNNKSTATGSAIAFNFATSSSLYLSAAITGTSATVAQINLSNVLGGSTGYIVGQMGGTARIININLTGTTFYLVGSTAAGSADTIALAATLFHINEYFRITLHFTEGKSVCFVQVEAD